MDWAIDDFLGSRDPFHMGAGEIRERKLVAIRQALEHHFERCAAYRRFCEGRGFEPSAVRAFEDLVRIPLFSTRAFKAGLDLLSVPESEVVKVHTSSGTSGTQSRVPRDRVTLDRFERSLEAAILGVQGESGYIAMLGPSPEELGDLAFANWAAVGCSLAKDHEYFLRGLRFEPDRIVAEVNATPHRPVQIGGAPMLILELAKHVMATGSRITSLDAESRITSGGGFKMLTGELVTREEYDARVMEAFAVPRSAIRDAYSMTELNGMVAECSENLKHVPPWLHLSVRDPAHPEREVGKGEEGLPGFLDAAAHAYPGFVMADDMVRVVVGEGETCRCGRVGPCLAPVVRRAEGAEARGCGRHIEELRAGAR